MNTNKLNCAHSQSVVCLQSLNRQPRRARTHKKARETEWENKISTFVYRVRGTKNFKFETSIQARKQHGKLFLVFNWMWLCFWGIAHKTTVLVGRTIRTVCVQSLRLACNVVLVVRYAVRFFLYVWTHVVTKLLPIRAAVLCASVSRIFARRSTVCVLRTLVSNILIHQSTDTKVLSAVCRASLHVKIAHTQFMLLDEKANACTQSIRQQTCHVQMWTQRKLSGNCSVLRTGKFHSKHNTNSLSYATLWPMRIHSVLAVAFISSSIVCLSYGFFQCTEHCLRTALLAGTCVNETSADKLNRWIGIWQTNECIPVRFRVTCMIMKIQFLVEINKYVSTIAGPCYWIIR